MKDEISQEKWDDRIEEVEGIEYFKSDYKAEINPNGLEFNINSTIYPEISDHNLTFGIKIDYDLDGNLDYLYISNSSNSVDLVIFDGVTNNIMDNFENVIDTEFEFTGSIKSIDISNKETLELFILFRHRDVSELCNFRILDIESQNIQQTSITPVDCREYLIVIDWDADGFDEVLTIENSGDYFVEELGTPNLRAPNGNLKPSELTAAFETLQFGNFTGDEYSDIAVTRGNDNQIYIIDGFSLDLIYNLSLSEEILEIEILDIDNKNLDEILVFSVATGGVKALNVSDNSIIQYSQFQTGYNYEEIKVIPDINQDNIEDLILLDENGLVILLNGSNGNMLLTSPILDKIQNSIRPNSEVSIAEISDLSNIVLRANHRTISINIMKTEIFIEKIYEIPWSTVLSRNELNFNSFTSKIYSQSLTFHQDLDKDGLNGFDEFLLGTNDLLEDSESDGLSDKQEVLLNLNPLSSDSDADGMPDKYEIQQDLDWDTNDADGDYDRDDLSNYQEYNLGTDPKDPDTDNDECIDGWEVNVGTNPLLEERFFDDDEDGLENPEECEYRTHPLKPDTDGDGMRDDFEVEYFPQLDPLDLTDANLDIDGDGLTNLEEYLASTDPTNPDTDGDGMLDKYEVENGLDPNRNDRNEDKDNDLINNGIEYDRGLNANGRYDRFISYFTLFALISLCIISIYYYRKLDKEAKDRGFRNYIHYRSIRQRGFNSLMDFENAKKNGFRISEAQVLINSYGFNSIDSLIKHWGDNLARVEAFINNSRTKKALNGFTSAKNFNEFESKLDESKSYAKELSKLILNSKQLMSEVEAVVDLINRSKIYPFARLTSETVYDYKVMYSNSLSNLTSLESKYEIDVHEYQNWFKPWPALLSVVQMTSDRSKINLDEISRILSIDESHSEELIKGIVADNPLIGSYSDIQKQFTKGTNVDGYIKFVRDKITDEGESGDSNDS